MYYASGVTATRQRRRELFEAGSALFP